MQNIKSITITKPDDFHIHLRENSMLNLTIEHAAKQFGKILVMPNLSEPITYIDKSVNYHNKIKQILDKNKLDLSLLMTLYLTDNTDINLIKNAHQLNLNYLNNNICIIGCKLYPAGATTNSDFGVTNINKIYKILEAMEENNLALLVHGEVVDQNIDIFDREKIFIDKILVNIREKFPNLKISLEHISTKEGVDFVLNYYSDKNTAATITPHHLLLNTNDLLAGGLKPHNYCLPIIKNMTHQKAVQQAALSGLPCFFAGSDSAPHITDKKLSSCGCAGIYHGDNTVLYYTKFFADNNKLDLLESFVSFYGSDFYNLNRNKDTITLENTSHSIPREYKYIDYQDNNKAKYIVPLLAGQDIFWQISSK